MNRCLISVAALLVGFAVGLARHSRDAAAASAASLAGSQSTLAAAQVTDRVEVALAKIDACTGLRDLAALGPLLEALDPTQIAALLDRLERDKLGRHGPLLRHLIRWWVRREPDATAAWIEPRLNRMLVRRSPRASVVWAWAAAAPREAMETFRRFPDSPELEQLIALAMRSWPEQEPATRARMLLDFPSRAAVLDELAKVLREWLAKDRPAALAAVAELREGAERDAVLRELFGKPDPLDSLELAAQTRFHDPVGWRNLFSAATVQDPTAAAAWLERAGGPLLATHAAAVAGEWAKKDPVAALDWAAAQGVVTSKPTPLIDFAYPGSRHEIVSLKDGPLQPVLDEALSKDPAATIAWLRDLPGSPERTAWVERASRAEILSQPAGASSFETLAALIAGLPPESAAQAAYELAHRAAPEQAIRWAQSLPAGPVRERAWEGVGDNQPAFPNLPAGPDRDALFSGVARQRARTASESMPDALAFVAQIESETVRRRAFDEAWSARLESGFVSSDHAGDLRKTLEQAQVSEEWKQAWRGPLQTLAGKGAK